MYGIGERQLRPLFDSARRPPGEARENRSSCLSATSTASFAAWASGRALPRAAPLLRLPEPSEGPYPVPLDERLVVEFYARKQGPAPTADHDRTTRYTGKPPDGSPMPSALGECLDDSGQPPRNLAATSGLSRPIRSKLGCARSECPAVGG
jgi:hypothetical protein